MNLPPEMITIWKETKHKGRLLRKRNPGVKHQSISRSKTAHVNQYYHWNISCYKWIYMDKCLKHYIPCSVLKIAGIRMGKFVECVSICLKGQTMQKVTICQLMFLVVETCNMQGLIPENTLSFELSRWYDHAWAVNTQAEARRLNSNVEGKKTNMSFNLFSVK